VSGHLVSWWLSRSRVSSDIYLDLRYNSLVSSDLSYRDRDTMIRLAAEMNDAQMAKRLGCSSFTIRFWRDRHGLPRSKANPGGIRWKTNRDFFAKIDTPEKAYVLGFIIADGSVHKSGKAVTFVVKESDADILRSIAAATGCDAPLYPKIARGGGGPPERHQLALHLSGRKLVEDLATLGVFANKSLTATFPAIPSLLERHMIRGLWDGDGWVGKRQFSLIGTTAVTEGAADAIECHTGHRLARSLSNGFPRVQGGRKARAVMEWMYADAPISLARKAEAFRLYWS
jgi:hypothetical protein